MKDYFQAVRSHKDSIHAKMKNNNPNWVPKIGRPWMFNSKTTFSKLLVLSEAQNHRCCYCGCKMRLFNRYILNEILHDDAATFEHVIPRSHGGSDQWVNLVVACRQCNNNRNTLDAMTFYYFIQDSENLKTPLDKNTRQIMERIHKNR
jgi:5-methylcytosine-specific restriction endonuclease McrA